MTYVEPKDYTPGPCVCDEEVPESKGVAGLMQKDTIGVLEPENLERKKRRRKDEK